MKLLTKTRKMRTKLSLVLALFPPALYIGLLSATPMPYSPIVDYVLLHSSQYRQEVFSDAAWLQASQRALHDDVASFNETSVTAWAVPVPTYKPR